MLGADPREEVVLVLTPTGRDARLIADELGRHGFGTLVCATLDALCAELVAGVGTAVLAEEALPPAGLTGLVATLKAQPSWSDLPLLVLTGKGTPSAGSVRRFEELEPAANLTQLERPVHTRTLVSAVRSALRARRRQYDVRSHLAERERLAETLGLGMDAAELGTWEWDPVTDGMVLSARAAAIYGIDPVGPHRREVLRGLLHPDDRERARVAVERAVATRSDYDIEYRLLPPGGGLRWVAVRGRGVYDAAGTLTRLLGVAQDVTDRAHAQQALRASEERYRALTVATSDVVYRMSADWTEMSSLDGRNLIASNSEPIRDWLPKHIPAHEQARVREAITIAITGKRTFELEHQVVRPDGSFGWTFSRAVPILDGAGNVVEWFGTARDVTERKRAEEALRTSESRFRTLFDSMDQGFCVIEVMSVGGRADDYRFVEMNPAFERHSGLRDVLGRSVREAVPGLEEFWFDTYGQVAATGEATRFVHHAAPLGRWFEVYAFCLEDADRHRVAILFTDISDRKRAEEELWDADKRKDEFLATLAHELRNPLAPVRTGLQVMKLAPPDAPAVAQARDMMERQLGHMVRLIDDLLDISRVSRGKLNLQMAKVDLRAVVETAVETSRPLIDASRHTLTVDVPAEPVWVDADLTRLAQVVSNVLTNAAKYTPDGGRITLIARRDAGEAIITVTDTGLGIPADMLAAVFDLFAQVNRTLDRAQGGLGIGLALVRKLMEMHGGTITAESPGPGRGSTFTVRLPMAAVAAPPAAVRAEGETTRPAGRRVLVVDDNRDGAETLATLLELSGHAARVAHDGPAALAAARAFDPQVVFLDIGMPGMSGYEVARRFRGDERLRGAVLVALTGWGSEDDKLRSREAGFDFHLTKPVEPRVVEEVLGRFSSIR